MRGTDDRDSQTRDTACLGSSWTLRLGEKERMTSEMEMMILAFKSDADKNRGASDSDVTLSQVSFNTC